MTTQELPGGSNPAAQRRLGTGSVVAYTVGGCLFGFVFPVGATAADILIRGLPLTLESVAVVQAGQPLHWIIDSAPVVLAAAGWLAGVRQSRAEQLSAELEMRVASRTAELAANTARLQVVAEVGSFITRARRLDDLLDGVVNLLAERFAFYHVQVFLVEEGGRLAVLWAATGEAGRELLARGHRLEVGSRSPVGQAAAHAEAAIAPGSEADLAPRRSELLPDTRSEMALPLKVGGRTLGVLDVHSSEADAFSAEDIPVFQTVADQLAVAIDNVQLLEATQRSLRDIEALNRQLTGEAWRDFVAGLAADAPLGYRADARGLHPLDGTVGGEDASEGAASLPIKVRGQTIGSLDVGPEGAEELDEEVRAILEAVAERVALALDNTRLSQQAQRTAQVQQLINAFADKLQRAPNVRAILRLVATEASQILNAPRGFVQLETRGGSEPGQQQ